MNKAHVAERLMRFEGETDYMYRGASGAVTVGVGHVIPFAQVALTVRWHGSPSNEAIMSDWMRVSGAPSGMPARRYAGLTRVRLDSVTIYDMLDSDIGQMTAAIAAALPKFGEYPDSAQEALLDLGFRLGLPELLKCYKLLSACRARDWAAAALEWSRHGADARDAEICTLLSSAGESPPKRLVSELKTV